MEDKLRAKRQSMSRTDDKVQRRVREVLNSDRRLNVHMATDESDIDKITVRSIS